MTVLLIYDIPTTKKNLLVRVWRELKKIGAQKLVNSVWSVENEIQTEIITEIKNMILKAGGNAKIVRVVSID
ncbi:MAG: hypothetical protein QXO84_02205 [Candidatus Aenigmatarchaeota archaeon]